MQFSVTRVISVIAKLLESLADDTDDADDAKFPTSWGLEKEVMVMLRVRASRAPMLISMPTMRRKVAARRN